MPTCNFCGKEYKAGNGFTFFKRLGQSLHFCSRKCSRYYEMKKSPKKLKWTAK